jgi:hypothetical protein
VLLLEASLELLQSDRTSGGEFREAPVGFAINVVFSEDNGLAGICETEDPGAPTVAALILDAAQQGVGVSDHCELERPPELYGSSVWYS